MKERWACPILGGEAGTASKASMSMHLDLVNIEALGAGLCLMLYQISFV
jgi:hypothetical protein